MCWLKLRWFNRWGSNKFDIFQMYKLFHHKWLVVLNSIVIDLWRMVQTMLNAIPNEISNLQMLNWLWISSTLNWIFPFKLFWLHVVTFIYDSTILSFYLLLTQPLKTKFWRFNIVSGKPKAPLEFHFCPCTEISNNSFPRFLRFCWEDFSFNYFKLKFTKLSSNTHN